MHILGLSRTLPFHSIGGMQAIAWDLFKEFVRLGHRVTIITTRIPSRPERFLEDGVEVISLQCAAPERYSNKWWSESRRVALEMPVRVDAVLSISAAGAGLLPIKAALGDVPFLFQAHGTSWGEFLSKWRSGNPVQYIKSIKNIYWMFKDAFIYKKFDEVILVGDVLERQFSSWPLSVLAPTVRRTVIRNGVGADVFFPNDEARRLEREKLGFLGEEKVVVFAARLHPQKGGRQAVLAFKELLSKMPDSRLLIVGGGEDELSLRKLVEQSNLSNVVRFTGAVPRDRIPGLLASGDVFIFPTLRQEGLPMNVLEALSCGLPAVCSESTRDVFSPQLPISYVDPFDAKSVGDELRNFLIGSSDRRSLLTPEYMLSACAQDYVKKIESLLVS